MENENRQEDALLKHALAEYEILEKLAAERMSKLEGNEAEDAKSDREYAKAVSDSVIELIKLFSSQGHSNMSAQFVLGEFMRLANFKTLSPLTGEDSEWAFAYDSHGKKVEQNRRCPSVFRENGDNSTATYSGGRVFSDDGGKTWYANSHSTVKIEFPFDVPDQPERVTVTTEEKERMEVEDMRALIKYVKDNPDALNGEFSSMKDKIEKDIAEFYERHPEEKPND